MELTAIDWARLAAFIDGEGCISIYVRAKSPKGKPRYDMKLTVTNTDSRLMLWLQRFGVGRIKVSSPKRLRWRSRYDWIVSGRQAASLLCECLPYMVLKQEQAVLAACFQSTRRRWGPKGIPDNVQHAATFCFNKVSELKGRLATEIVQ